jgi:hypothetical protein
MLARFWSAVAAMVAMLGAAAPLQAHEDVPVRYRPPGNPPSWQSSASRSVRASARKPSGPPAPLTGQGLVLDGWIGGGTSSVVDGSSAGAAVLGVTGLYYYRWFEAGAGLTMQFLFDSNVIVAGLAGFKVEPEPESRVRIDILAEAGMNAASFENGLFSTVVSGGNAVLPYVGGRLGLSALLGQHRRFVLGWWVSAGDAIGSVVVNSVISSCLLGCSTFQTTDTIGGWIFSTGLRIGGDIAKW